MNNETPTPTPTLPPEVQEALYAAAKKINWQLNTTHYVDIAGIIRDELAPLWPRPALDVDAVLAKYVSDPKDDGTYTLSLNAEETTKLRADLMRLIPRPAPVTADARELAERVISAWECSERIHHRTTFAAAAAVLAPVLAALEEERERSATHEYFKEQAHKATDEWKARAEAAERDAAKAKAAFEERDAEHFAVQVALNASDVPASGSQADQVRTLQAMLEAAEAKPAEAVRERDQLRAEVERLTRESDTRWNEVDAGYITMVQVLRALCKSIRVSWERCAPQDVEAKLEEMEGYLEGKHPYSEWIKRDVKDLADLRAQLAAAQAQAREAMEHRGSRAVAIAKAEENEAAGKGGDISPLNERETKAFWNGYWAAAHNIAHGLEKLAQENAAAARREGGAR